MPGRYGARCHGAAGARARAVHEGAVGGVRGFGRREGGSAAGASRGGRSTGTITARFAGRCHCGKAYAAKEPIAKNPNGWGHPECRTAPA